MPVVIDLSADELRALLEQAKVAGFVNLDQLTPFFIIERPTPADIDETADALWAIGVELTEGMTVGERDRQDETFVDSLRSLIANGGHASLTGYGWASFHRGVEKKKREGDA